MYTSDYIFEYSRIFHVLKSKWPLIFYSYCSELRFPNFIDYISVRWDDDYETWGRKQSWSVLRHFIFLWGLRKLKNVSRLQVSGSRIKHMVFYIRIIYANHSTVIFKDLQRPVKLNSLIWQKFYSPDISPQSTVVIAPCQPTVISHTAEVWVLSKLQEDVGCSWAVAL
jgi:hypothetical protein